MSMRFASYVSRCLKGSKGLLVQSVQSKAFMLHMLHVFSSRCDLNSAPCGLPGAACNDYSHLTDTLTAIHTGSLCATMCNDVQRTFRILQADTTGQTKGGPFFPVWTPFTMDLSIATHAFASQIWKSCRPEWKTFWRRLDVRVLLGSQNVKHLPAEVLRPMRVAAVLKYIFKKSNWFDWCSTNETIA